MSAEEKTILQVPDYLTVRELADLMKESPIVVMKRLISNGIMATINQQVDYDTAAIVIAELGYQARPMREVEEEKKRVAAIENRPEWRKAYTKEDKSKLKRRPPVVTILGHVDHGKTSLLDAIRRASVAEGEAGGITQHIGAYQVEHNGERITFLDTPGHAAFTAMRARGAQGADIAILVVAADDGVMPTTKEALTHARAADVPIIVALSKIDKPNANPDLVKQQLSELGLVPDEWGGSTMVIPVSAREKVGINDLLEAILLVAGEHDIVANPNKNASGVVLESKIDGGRGPIATLLVQNGTLHVGDVVVAGLAQGRIKAMFDENNRKVESAEPSKPVSVMGLDETAPAGTPFETMKDPKSARKLVEERRLEAAARAKANATPKLSLEDLFARFEAGNMQELRLIVKVDVDGSLEPVVNSLKEIKMQEGGPKINLIHAEVGNITENDVNLAQSTGAVIIGFNTEADNAARRAADSFGVDIRTYNVIYKLLEDIELSLAGLLEPVYEDKVIGRAEVRAIFNIPKIGAIAGSFILEGAARRNAKAQVRRGKDLVAEKQSVSSLKRFEEDVREVRAGFECGIGLANFHEYQKGDIIEFVVSERVN
jgi:translation initiation factor IF-2